MLRLPASVVVLVSLAASAAAQCDLAWQPGDPVPSTSHRVTALAVLPQGDLVAGGWFEVAGTTRADRVARWDGSAWHPLGAGLNDAVNTVAAMPNGDVVVGGVFTSAGGNAIANIARWDGSSWTPLGVGLNGPVHALRVAPNGDLLAGGVFTASGGQQVHRIARFDGTVWSQVGTGVDDGGVFAIEVMPNGDIAIGGSLLTAGGMPVGSAAIWNGAAWQAIGSTGSVFALRVLPNGHLVCGGRLALSPAHNLAVFDGSSLQPLTIPIIGDVCSVMLDAAGDLVVSGGAAGASVTGVNVVRRQGGTWSALFSSNYTTFALALRNGRIVGGAGPTGGASVMQSTVQEYDGTSWTPVGGVDAALTRSVRAGRNGEVFVTGYFTSIGGVAANNVARRVGSSWAPLGPGVNGETTAVAVTPSGDLIVGGNFTLAGGAPANRIARWNGVSWSTLGAGLTAAPTSLATGPGDVVVAAVGGLMQRFANGVWAPLAAPALGSTFEVEVLPDGDVLALGSYHPRVWRWDGATWTPLPPTPYFPSHVAVVGNGDIYLAPFFGSPAPSNRVARLVGSSWQLLGASPFDNAVRGLLPLPNGDLLAFGTFSEVDSVAAANLARWTGTAWQAVDGGLTIGLGSFTSVLDATMATTGELFVTGAFAMAGNHVSSRFARALPTCPAAAVPFGAGCTGSAGALSLAPQNLPFAGATFRAEATGFTPLSLGLHVLGFTPMLLPLPGGAPGCALFTTPDVLDVLLPTAGAADVALAVPANPAVVGVVVRSQVVGLEFDASLALVRTTSTNAVQLTVGGY